MVYLNSFSEHNTTYHSNYYIQSLDVIAFLKINISSTRSNISFPQKHFAALYGRYQIIKVTNDYLNVIMVIV